MCIFLDMFEKKGFLYYPSVRVFFKDDTEKIYSDVQYVYANTEASYITLTRIGTTSDLHEEVRLENVKYIKVENK